MKRILCYLLIFSFFTANAQSNKELAKEKARQAIKLEDEDGKYTEALQLLEEAQRLDPDEITYPYELAYTYTAMKEYKKASDILEKLLTHKDLFARVYQSLGNAYDYQGLSDKAIRTYEDGLKKFPNSGGLYLELGNMQRAKEDYNKALDYYEKGIEQDPAYSSNYYWAARIFCQSTEEVWGMIYGEIFMNLEPGSDRTATISKLLYDTYRSQITFPTDTSAAVSFSRQGNTISLDDLKDPAKFKLPFGSGAYEFTLILAIMGERKIDLPALNRIRTKFTQVYFSGKNGRDYPNVLFEYQKKMMDAGHLEAYNFWLLSRGEEAAFANWRSENEDKWNDFVKWFTSNPLTVDLQHRFYRKQY